MTKKELTHVASLAQSGEQATGGQAPATPHRQFPYPATWELMDESDQAIYAAMLRRANLHDELVAALKKLRNEASALMAFEYEIRAVAGNTNVEVLLQRLHESGAVLAKLAEAK